jgi:hypothetical protein
MPLYDQQRDLSTGTFLCEICFDAMTDTVLSPTRSPTGIEIAVCEACQGVRRPVRWVCGGDFDEVQRWARDQHLQGVLPVWDLRVVMTAQALAGLHQPVVYLVGTYAARQDWPAIEAVLQACQARWYPVE